MDINLIKNYRYNGLLLIIIIFLTCSCSNNPADKNKDINIITSWWMTWDTVILELMVVKKL